MSGGGMDRPGRLLAVGLLWGALALAACGGQNQTASTSSDRSAGGQARSKAAGATKPEANLVPKPAAPDPYSASAGDSSAALVSAVRSYVRAIDRRDGRALCSMLLPGALAGVHLPRHAGGCAASMRASIGYSARPSGAWRRTRLRRIERVEIDPNRPAEARVRALMVHTFTGHREPSIEDDLIYLRFSGGHWLIVKPSSSFYRAIDARDVPLRAITPPVAAR
jgi:hypothetical protein